MSRKTWIKIGLCILAALLAALLIWRCSIEPKPAEPTDPTDQTIGFSAPSSAQTEPSQEAAAPTTQATEPTETQQATEPATQVTEPVKAQQPQGTAQPPAQATQPPKIQQPAKPATQVTESPETQRPQGTTPPPAQATEPKETQHQHSWQAVSHTVHHEAEYKEVSHPEQWEEVWVVDRPAKADTIEQVPIYATRDVYIVIDIRTGEEFRFPGQWEEARQKAQELGVGNYRVGGSSEQYISGYEEKIWETAGLKKAI